MSEDTSFVAFVAMLAVMFIAGSMAECVERRDCYAACNGSAECIGGCP